MRGLLTDLRPLRESAPFRRLWVGTSLSSIGGAMTGFALMLQVYDLIHSSAAVGAIGLAQAVPLVLRSAIPTFACYDASAGPAASENGES